MRISPTSASSRRQTAPLVFSINDFDETLPGPFEWDVPAARRKLRGRGTGSGLRRRNPAAYRDSGYPRFDATRRFAEMRNVDVWYARLDVARIRNRFGSGTADKQMKRFQLRQQPHDHERLLGPLHPRRDQHLHARPAPRDPAVPGVELPRLPRPARLRRARSQSDSDLLAPGQVPAHLPMPDCSRKRRVSP